MRNWMTVAARLCEVGIPECAGPCLYHATYRRHLRNIMTNGLGAAKMPIKNFSVSRAGVVYLTNDPDAAENYAKEALTLNGESEAIIILAIDQRQLDPERLHKDENDIGDMAYQEPEGHSPEEDYDQSYNSYEYHGVIPPSALSVWWEDG